jgi:catechol-2,3-dioxygenase
VNHIALRVGSLAELEAARGRLEAHGVEVIGVTDHHFVKSIYFFDPNGFRLELTAFVGEDGYMAVKERSAHAECAAWTREKAARRRVVAA